MTEILNASKLKDKIAKLNELLKSYSIRYKTIAEKTCKDKDIIKKEFNKNLEAHDNATEDTIEKIREDFLKTKEEIENISQREINAVTQTIEEQNSLSLKHYEEKAETVRRHSRETILELRKQHENKLSENHQKFEQTSLIYSEQLEKYPTYKKVTQKINVQNEPENLIEKLTENTPEDNRQNILLEYDFSNDHDETIQLKEKTEELYEQLIKSKITRFFIKCPPTFCYLLIIILSVSAALSSQYIAIKFLTIQNCLYIAIGLLTLLVLLHLIHILFSTKKLKELSKCSNQLYSKCQLCLECLNVQQEQQIQTINEELKNKCEREEESLKEIIQGIDLEKFNELRELKGEVQDSLSEQKNDAAQKLDLIAAEQNQKLEAIESEELKNRQKLIDDYDKKLQQIISEEEQALKELNNSWQKQWFSELEDFEHQQINSNNLEEEIFPSWSQSLDEWQPPRKFTGAIPFGSLSMDLKKELKIPEENCLDLEDGVPFNIPALLELPHSGSLSLRSKDEEGRLSSLKLLQNLCLRILMTLPPGKARFNFIDPLSLGENFAGFMHLNDYKDDLAGGRIATNSRQIEKILTDLNEHMETVIQKYLRNEFDDISQYNEAVGEISEPFRFLVIADLPVNFSEEAIKRLISISKSGSRCGVYILMHRDVKHHIPGDFTEKDLEGDSAQLEFLFNSLDWRNCGFKLADFIAEELPSTQWMNDIIHKIGTASIDATRVEIPFEKIKNQQLWQMSSAENLKTTIGLSGAKKQYLTFGHGTSQHALLAGKTGSGKSNLIHVIICNLALNYSPDELQFYLIDFKKGVEFKAYAQHKLPHAQAIAIESDREFGLSVLRKIDKDLQQRGELLRQAGVQNITQYKQNFQEKLSRILLVIDEFQEIFVEDDMIAQEASLLLDRIVRQGRAFGIHVILASQTLAGSYSLPRTTMGQMSIRIALQCSESDSYVILNESNNAARLLNRPGEAIYNDQAGLTEGNTPFQAAYLNEDEKNRLLEEIISLKHSGSPFIFEGNIPAVMNNSKTLSKLQEHQKPTLKLILGEPNAIKDSQSVTLENMPGQNLLIIGQKEETALATFTSIIISAIRQKPAINIYIFDGSSSELPRSPYLEELSKLLNTSLTIIKPGQSEDRIKEIYTLKDSPQQTDSLICFLGLQKFRKLKNEDNFSWDDNQQKSSGEMLSEIISEGPSHKIHTICWVDSFTSFSRMLPRKALNDFIHRILFQMSQTDSISLMDSAEASKLNLHTALVFDDQSGDYSKYRPFSLPNLTADELP